MSKPINILHLSDLHFGFEPTSDPVSTAQAQRLNTLNALIDALNRLDSAWKPDMVAITGDIGWKGVQTDYDLAEEWLSKLLKTLNLTSDKLIMCAGNHDLDRNKTFGMAAPSSAQQADEWLQSEHLENFIRPFNDYTRFYEHFGAAPLTLNDQSSFLLGQWRFGELNFIVLNSAWFCSRGDDDRDNLWLGLPQLQVMDAKGLLVNSQNYDDVPLTIVLFHHPPDMLNEAERYSFNDRMPAFNYLAEKCHLMLCGHTHGAPKKPDRIASGAYLCSGGATYNRAQYRNNFSVFQINSSSRIFDRITYEFDPRKEKWYEYSQERCSLKQSSQPEISETDEQLPEIPQIYKDWLIDHCRDMDFTKLIGASQVIQVGLPEIFIPLLAPLPQKAVEYRKQAKQQMSLFEDRNRDIEELIDENEALVIEGLAGSGKTTLIKHYAFQMIDKKRKSVSDDCLPVLIFLKDLQSFDIKEHYPNATAFENLIEHYLEKAENGLDLKTVQGFCKQGQAVFLLDGLDEIRPDLRAFLTEACAGFRRLNPGARLVLTGRPHGVDATVRKWFSKELVSIEPLTMEQIETFVHQWFAHVFSRESQFVSKTADDMIGEIKSHPSIDQLTDTPLMLTAICLLYHDDKELPDQRAELYHKFVNNLLHRRFKEPEKVRNFLMELAYDMHKRRVKGIDRNHAVDILCKKYTCGVNEPENDFCQRIDARFEDIEPKCALLHLKDGQYGFLHLTFQEFLTAIALTANVRKDHAAEIRDYWDDEWWQEVIELYISYLSIDSRGIANEIILEVFEKPYQKPYYCWRLAARTLVDIHHANREKPTLEKARTRLTQIMHSDAEPKHRADAGEILGRLGDNRDLKKFIPVKPGNYTLSAGKKEIKPFEIAKYPVTNSQFKEFVDAKGYEKELYWSEQGLRWLEENQMQAPRYWYDRQWNCPNSPVVGVCWYEADAFCRWLTENDSDYQYFLPDENQWEAAATGFDKRKYPWGAEWQENYCNSEESGIEKTSAVGLFEKGDTPEGVADMAGNVWEWTASDYHSEQRLSDFDYEPEIQKLLDAHGKSSGEEKDKLLDQYIKRMDEKDRTLSVLRGGSWDDDHDYVRCANRYRFIPDLRGSLVGLRCSRTKI
ncbi:SUMF1/EgtB/PvdO family nonheme iron enzyme [Desulfococcaceae bacterium HSG9]|nr:SUMF1/EgtB/PvdO family nonheme iron enzyme [Desulfococcaceae bacterium HSG9]